MINNKIRAIHKETLLRKWDSRVQWNSLQGLAGQDFTFPKTEVIRGLHDVHGVWKEVAKEARVSYNSKQFYEGDISIPWQLVTQLVQESLDISDARLCENVGKVFQVMPNAGETYIIGSL